MARTGGTRNQMNIVANITAHTGTKPIESKAKIETSVRPGTSRNEITRQRSPSHGAKVIKACFPEPARRSRRISRMPQTTRQTPRMRGNSDGPYFCPGKGGNDAVRAIISTARAIMIAPDTVSVVRIHPPQREPVRVRPVVRQTRRGLLVAQAFLARPAAVMAFAMAASPLAMKAANPPASAHFKPKPRLAMKSLNSVLS